MRFSLKISRKAAAINLRLTQAIRLGLRVMQTKLSSAVGGGKARKALKRSRFSGGVARVAPLGAAQYARSLSEPGLAVLPCIAVARPVSHALRGAQEGNDGWRIENTCPKRCGNTSRIMRLHCLFSIKWLGITSW